VRTENHGSHEDCQVAGSKLSDFEFAGTTLLNFDILLKRGKEYYEET